MMYLFYLLPAIFHLLFKNNIEKVCKLSNKTVGFYHIVFILAPPSLLIFMKPTYNQLCTRKYEKEHLLLARHEYKKITAT